MQESEDVMESKVKVPLTPAEREMYRMLAAMTVMMANLQKPLENVCSRVGAESVIGETLEKWREMVTDIFLTLPDKQMKQVAYESKNSFLHMDLKRATGKPKDWWVLSYDEICVLIDNAIRTTCLACEGNKHKCELRDVIKNMPVLDIDRYYTPCWRDE